MKVRILAGLISLLAAAGCATPEVHNQTAQVVQQEMEQIAQQSAIPVNDALLPPLTAELPKVENKSLEARFDLVVNNTPATQVFMAIVSGTRYSMLLHPEVSGNISLNLKDVTVFDALEAIRELYGYDYKSDGKRIFIMPLTLQTRIFHVNYLTGQREGKSTLRVTSGSVTDSANNATSSSGQSSGSYSSGGSSYSGSSQHSSGPEDSSKVSMTSRADFWAELETALKAIVGNDQGRSVVVSPMTGVIVVRAMPDELKSIGAFLRASQLSVERQVILEAKIVEVQLNDSFQSGVNWAGMGNLKASPNSWATMGQLSPGASMTPSNTVAGPSQLTSAALNALPGGAIASTAATGTGTLFGLAFQTTNFAALLNFLESQGNVHVLSSPRIATLNNQKAVLKVGTDEFFVTNVSTTTTTGTATTSTPSVTLQPFFSGIALDVTPRIDEDNEIILHVHPSVSSVTTVNKVVDVGGVGGTLNLPLASSSISETDSIVRARDGQIVAIGGLMRQATFDDQSGLPGLPKQAFGQTNKRTEKRELVILLKPTVVDSDKDWSDDITRSRDRFNNLKRGAVD